MISPTGRVRDLVLKFLHTLLCRQRCWVRCLFSFPFIFLKSQEMSRIQPSLMNPHTVFADNPTSYAGAVVIGKCFVYAFSVADNNIIFMWEVESMKKLLALLFAVILVCSIVATCVAGCSYHVPTYHSTYTSYYTRPRWTNCANNPYNHAHTQSCKDTIKVYLCRTCGYSYTTTTTTVLSETCPCAH